MRFFKGIEGPRSAEDEAAYTRLMAIAERSKVRDTFDPETPSSSESPDEPEAGKNLQ